MNTSKPTGGENTPTEEPQTGKPQVKQESPQKWNKGQTRSSRQGDQRDHTTEFHRTPIVEVYPTKTASEAENQ